MPPTPKAKQQTREERTGRSSREAELQKRAAARNYRLEEENGQWYASIGGTRFGPMQSLDELDELLPAG